MKRCPLLNKECIAEKCAWYQEFTMRDIPSQGVRIEKDCAISRIPMMLLDVIQNTNGTAAAVESRGNEMIKKQEVTNKLFAGMAQLAVDRHELGNGSGPARELPGANPAR